MNKVEFFLTLKTSANSFKFVSYLKKRRVDFPANLHSREMFHFDLRLLTFLCFHLLISCSSDFYAREMIHLCDNRREFAHQVIIACLCFLLFASISIPLSIIDLRMPVLILCIFLIYCLLINRAVQFLKL